MVMRRIEGWPLQLSAFLKARKKMDFVWGVNDCLMMPADCVLLLTGVDPAAQWRGKYSTEEEAYALLEKHGGVAGIITEGLGFKGTREILTAKRGDVVISKTSVGIMGGVVDDSGQRIAVPLSDQKTLVRLPLEMAWRVWSY